jgi:S-adenosylmethionine decarboxylase
VSIAPSPLVQGEEWIVEAFGCDASLLADQPVLMRLCDRIVIELGLNPVGDGQWHVFPAPGGITGMLLLAESHLTLHTFPEHASLCLNLFCCAPRPPWPFAERLAEALDARSVEVQRIDRVYGRPAPLSLI